jgi:hypothetical protein
MYQNVPQIPVQGFSIDTSSSPIQVSLSSATSLLVFGQTYFQGSNDSSSISSLIVRSDCFALLDVAAGPVNSLQVHDGIYDAAAWNLGSGASFTLNTIKLNSDITDTSPYCTRGKFRDKDACSPCASSCATCYGSHSNQCLSCDDGFRLSAGSCVSVVCLGGASVVPGCAGFAR